MNRHDLLAGLHQAVAPRTYLEIGVNDGRSLTLSRARSIAVDPAFKVTSELHCDLNLVKATSDDFFARPDALDAFPGGTVDFGFIDGLHIFEFALRDFLNTERSTDWTGVLVFDDVLPRSIDEAARERHTMSWTGDVYKVIPVLQRYRPDLVLLPVDTAPTGMLVVLGADSGNTTLADHYDEIVAEFVVADPQPVPVEVLRRVGSVDPAALLAHECWAQLAAARESGAPRDASVYEPVRKLRGTGPVGPITPPTPGGWPPRRESPAAAPAKKAAPAKAAPAKAAPAKKAAPAPRTPPSVRTAAKALVKAVRRSATRRVRARLGR